MFNPNLYYPAKPYIVNQEWGISRPEVYGRFGFTRHNGVDIALGSDALIRAELPCEVVTIGWQPEGGGKYIGVISQEEFEDENGMRYRLLIDYLHLVKDGALVNTGDKLNTGDIIAVADNTGFSTGHHTHCQYRRVLWSDGSFTVLDKNEAHDSIDPTPFYNGIYAKDFQTVELIREETSKVGAFAIFKIIWKLLMRR